MIYQEPMASLNPAMRISSQLIEVPILHEKITKEEAWKRSIDMLEKVNLPDPERIMNAFPHQLSGGQQQRIVIAMALLSKPSLLLLDEPTTALDVTVEAGIINLVKNLSKEIGTSMLFVSHNLGLILETCNKITVMYSGETVETGEINEVFRNMRHPYTQGLLRSISHYLVKINMKLHYRLFQVNYHYLMKDHKVVILVLDALTLKKKHVL